MSLPTSLLSQKERYFPQGKLFPFIFVTNKLPRKESANSQTLFPARCDGWERRGLGSVGTFLVTVRMRLGGGNRNF